LQLSFFQLHAGQTKAFRATPLPVIKEIVSTFVPVTAINLLLPIFSVYPVHLRIVRHRHTKAGDFRPPAHGNPARITINGDLNPYAFLITLIHEAAHLHTTMHHRSPHGPEWKSAFRKLMQPFLTPEIFPSAHPSLLDALSKHMENPKASGSVDPALSRLLKQYDPALQGIHLEDLPVNSVFRIHNGKLFQKKGKLRKRYSCLCLQTKRTYLISPVALVYPAGYEEEY